MAFDIPNAASAEDPSQAMPDSRDFTDILIPSFSGTGVVTGCAVTPQGSPDMTVAVAAGTVAVAGVSVGVAGGNVVITAADATNPRFDLIVASNTGVKSAVAGVPAAAPVFPSAAGKVVLAAVRVPAGAASINAAKIVDKRVPPVISAPAQEVGSMKLWPSTVAPAAWVLCDGASYLRAGGTYDALFALIGTTFGSVDGTHFNVPDLRGRVPVGLGTHADVNALAKAEAGALVVGNRRPKHQTDATNLTITGAPGVGTLALPDHVHDVPHSNPVANNLPQNFAGSAIMDTGTTPTGNPTTHPAITGAPSVGSLDVGGAGGPSGTAPADEPAFLVINFIIKL